MLNFREVVEAFGIAVSWDEETRSVMIMSDILLCQKPKSVSHRQSCDVTPKSQPFWGYIIIHTQFFMGIIYIPIFCLFTITLLYL